MSPWNDWYHITGNTYGAWTPGDERGWKTRHARPQPGADGEPPLTETARSRLHAHVSRVLTREPVTLCPAARRAALDAILAALRHHEIEVIVAAVTDHHFHTLARCPDRKPRRWFGIAKKESARALSKARLVPSGGVWAVRTHCNPITDRAHQLAVTQYIADHASEGAAVWAIWHDRPGYPPDTL